MPLHCPSIPQKKLRAGLRAEPYQKARSDYEFAARYAGKQDDLSLWLHYPHSRFEEEAAVRASADVSVNIRSCIIEIAREHPSRGTIVIVATGQRQT
ncbi:hypothetical protein [Pseudomonas phage Bise]